MSRKKKDVEAALLSKGFRKEDNDHHFFIYHSIDGKKTRARTKTSHSSKMKDIDNNLLSHMAKQCKLENAQFLQLIDCPLDRPGYERVLREKEEL